MRTGSRIGLDFTWKGVELFIRLDQWRTKVGGFRETKDMMRGLEGLSQSSSYRKEGYKGCKSG